MVAFASIVHFIMPFLVSNQAL